MSDRIIAALNENLALERSAVIQYRALAEELLGDEVEHLRYLRAQQTQIVQLGLAGWLQNQAA